ncbi:MAG: glycine/betaine ABC transporter substrate-binding protein [Catenulispora sp. 13_1_20CM_3_70_7]|nr:MAG: glycine/betaine ABC transporter substrate-binding protein [Catenulispora sp. 13_1_20CM_3_70_7]
MRGTRAVFGVALAAVAVVATACGSGDPTKPSAAPSTAESSTTAGSSSTSGSPTPAQTDSIVVGSANFQESVVLADIYAEALKAKGVKVSTKLNIGSRETYIPALKDGSIDLLPEYSGVLLQYFDTKATAVSSTDVYAALQTAVPSGLTVLDQSSAEDKDAIVVSKDVAAKYHLTSIADLAAVAGKLTLGGPPEFKTRPDGVPGLKADYGVTFGSYKTLDAGGPLTVNALKNGQIDAGDIFTTDPSITQNGFVVLADPKFEFAAQNVLPLINKSKASDTVKTTLNAVSAKLDTKTLIDLLTKVVSDKQDPDATAKAWLTSVGLG